jgi:hypothetical protein
MNTPFRTAALVGLVAALTFPTAASASTPVTPGTIPAGHYQLNVREVVENHAGELDGVLSMTIYPDGTIQGTFRFLDDGSIQDVVGGLQSDGKLWLDLGAATPHGEYIYGTFRNGVISATVNRHGVNLVTFESTGPAGHP